MTYQTIADVADDLQEKILSELKTLGVHAFIGSSNVSLSNYITVQFERGDDIEDVKIRISDHDVVNPASISDFYIGLNQPMSSVNVRTNDVFERCELVATDWDDDGEAIDWDNEYVACEEHDEDAELAGVEIFDGFDEAIAAAVEFIKSKEEAND